VARLRVEEDHLRERRLASDELALLKEREKQEAALKQAREELHDAESRKTAADLRAQKAHLRDDAWNDSDADETTLRGRLAAIKQSIEVGFGLDWFISFFCFFVCFVLLFLASPQFFTNICFSFLFFYSFRNCAQMRITRMRAYTSSPTSCAMMSTSNLCSKHA
jgi:hypothetical protein